MLHHIAADVSIGLNMAIYERMEWKGYCNFNNFNKKGIVIVTIHEIQNDTYLSE